MNDLLTRPAGELAALIRDGELSSRELTQASLERIEALNPGLGAFVHVDPEGALAAAEAVAPGVRRGADRDQGHRGGGRDAVHDGVGHLRRLRARP